MKTDMKRFALLLFLLIALALPVTAHADSPSHLVAYGETLYSIARKYGVAPQALANANGLTLQSWVYAGQRLVIPGGAAAPHQTSASVAQTTPGKSYLVRAGDTLYSVARQFGVSVHAIAEANDIPPNGFLYTGWTLKIPGAASANPPPPAKDHNSAPAPAQNNPPPKALPQNNAPANTTNSRLNTTAVSYIVQPDDTLFRIAIRHGVTIQAISIANNLPNQFVFSGQRLTIPGAATNAPAINSVNASVSAATALSIRGVPLYRQQQTLTCEESVAAMATFGALSENQIVAAMEFSENPYEGIRGETNYELFGGLTHYGTYAQALKKGLAKLGRASTVYYGQPYENFQASILQNLREGRPVIWWTTWRESHQTPQNVTLSNGTKVRLTPYEHTVLIVAANAAGITYHDPYDGTKRFTSWANHQRTSGYFNNMALVVY
jgi:LysM repeat protein/uncharacterized protein YvpB